MAGAWPLGEQWAQARSVDLQNAWQMVAKSIEQRSLPSTADFTSASLMTSLAVLAAPALLAVLANRKGRKLILDTVETILATVLVILLLCIVLGLPIGAVYLMLKALSYILRSLWHSAAVSSALVTAKSKLGL